MLPIALMGLPNPLFAFNLPMSEDPTLPTNDLFPTQPPELAREVVTVAHFDLKRLQELVNARPSLARAAWDWGFGDWETPLGAASHMGNRPIAEYLISKGARLSLFSAAMLGQLEVVKAFVSAQPHCQRIRGPHSISLLAHAKAGGKPAAPVFEFLQSIGDADSEPQVALSDTDAASFVGTYKFGMGTNQLVEITAEGGHLFWTRIGTMPHTLFHLGGGLFYPAGADSVRIRFAEEKGSIFMTITDPDPVLTAPKELKAK